MNRGVLLILPPDCSPYTLEPMDSRTKVSPNLLSLIEEYEHNEQEGRILYLNDREYQDIIAYYDDEGEYQQAISVINNAIKQYSFRSDYLILKARVLIKQGLMNDAMEVINRAEVISPKETELQLLKVNIYIHQKNFDDAILLIEDLKAFASKQELEDVLIAESFFYESVQEFDRMFQCLKSVLILNPDNEEALYLMGASVEQSRNFEESILLHNVIVENHPYNCLAWYNLGHSYANVGEYEKAIEALEYTYIINPRFEAGYLDCAEYCRDRSMYNKALEIYKEALDIFGAEFDLLMAISECQYALGQVDHAKRSLFEAIEMDSYSEEAYFLLARCYMDNKDWRSAVKVLRKALSIENQVEEYYHALGKCYVALEDKNRAIYYLKKAAVKGCELSNYWEDYVIYLMSLHTYRDALDVIEDSEKYTFSYRLQYLEAACHIGLKDVKKGLSLLEEALIESFDDHNTLFEIPSDIYDHKDVKSILNYFENQ